MSYDQFTPRLCNSELIVWVCCCWETFAPFLQLYYIIILLELPHILYELRKYEPISTYVFYEAFAYHTNVLLDEPL